MTETLTRRIRDLGVTMRASSGRRTVSDDGWERDSYRVELARGGRTMRLEYHKGRGHNGSPPTLVEVLGCLILDQTGEPFESWASEYGYDTDSREDEALWRRVRKQSDDFAKLIGDSEILDALIYDTDTDA